MKPVIGITPDVQKADKPVHRRHEYYWAKKDLFQAVSLAGGIPFLLPVFETYPAASGALKRLDGLLISGGNFDIHPSFYGEKKQKKTGTVKMERTCSEFLLLKAALKAKMPTLGICGGHQLINVFLGGSLYQDILQDISGAKNHEQKTHYSKPCHEVNLLKGSRLAGIMGRGKIEANSTHHQSIKELGKGLRVNAVSKDGVIEGVEAENGSFLLGVQWHPEFLNDTDSHLRIFKSFIKASKKRGRE